MSVVPDPNALSEIPLFRGLPSEQLADLNRLFHRKTFAAGTTLMSVEQPGDAAYIILRGTVKVHVEQMDGSDVILAILGPGEVVGEMSLVDIPARSASVVTLEDCTLCWIDRFGFQTCLHCMPTLTYNLLQILARRLRLADAQIQSLSRQDVFARVARLILAFAEKYGQTDGRGDVLIPLRLTQTDLASMVGASRVRVNQVLAFYKERNYISIDEARHITVHDAPALDRRCQ